ncbi:MAG: DEAD/DEAH box helicase, partial [Nanoarchaeota archaeon]|nr:DEAD/DEAH box helicase [Nanoarchaeota archaeon]
MDAVNIVNTHNTNNMCTLKDFQPRLYQQTILGTTVNNNTLVVLPTGLGKTASAFMLAVQRLNKFPESKILMLAPTKPLCEQHVESFRKHIELNGDPEEKIVLFTGSVSPLKRASLWQEAKIIISTPQGLENDIINKRINFAEVSLLVFDECVAKGTKISLADGNRINIEKLEEKVSNEKILVNSLNEKTGCFEPAEITKFHKIKSNKKILQIKLKNKKIKVTEDHLFLSEIKGKIGWVPAKKLREGDSVSIFKDDVVQKNDRILVSKKEIINQFSKRQKDLFEQFLEVTKLRRSNGFGSRKISKVLNISEGAIRNWIYQPFRKPVIQNTLESLENKRLIPLTHNNPFLPIIARLFGHLFGDGWSYNDKKGIIIGFSGNIDDLKSIQSDLSLLGSKYSKIYSRNTTSVANHLSRGKKEITGISNSFTVSDRKITKLLVLLGLPIGNKTKNLFLIPEWIIKGPNRIKKEFLSALMGSEGYTPSLKRNLKTCNPVRLSFNLIKSLENEGLTYAQQIKNLFFDLKINVQISKRVGNIRKDGHHTVKFLLTLSNSNKSMIRFLREVNYSYAINKRIQGNCILKYLEEKEGNLKERISLSEKAKSLHKRGLGCHKIARELGLDRGTVENWIYYDIKPSMITYKMSKFDFNDNYYSKLLVKWERIERIGLSKNEEYVYDLTVEKNHNYIANNFIVHNCHHATGDYSYVWLAEQYQKNATNQRILALTASPGATLEKIQDIYQNLFIEQVEVKSEKDPDVKPYVQKTNVNWLELKFPKELEKLHDELKICAKKKVEMVKSLGFVNTQFLNKGQLLKLQGLLQNKLRQGTDFEVMKAISIVAEALKVEHALELLECQGLNPTHEYLHRLMEESKSTKVKAVKNLVRDPNFKAAVYWSESLVNREFEYPKLNKLNEIINEGLQKNPETKIIVFTNYRDSAQEISKVLEKQAVKRQLFFGQAKKDGVGFSQKKQKEILDKFRAGEFNVLVATSVAEEGLDIPKVDRVIFYEATASAI